MKSMMREKKWLAAWGGAGVLSLAACGGGGSGGGAATTSSASDGGTKSPATSVVAVQDQKLAAGLGYSLAVSTSGQVKAWGAGMHGTLSTTSTVAAVGTASWGADTNASWAVTSAGDLLYWGEDAAGKLTSKAIALSGLGSVAAARACGAGNGAMLYVLKADGSLWAVPARDLSDVTKGFAVTGVGQAKALSDGTDDSCSSMLAIDKDGGVWQLQASHPGDAAGVPTQAQGTAVPGLRDIVQAACSDSSCLAVDSTGKVQAWGKNDKGQLGDGSRQASTAPLVVNVPKTSKVWMSRGGAAYAITAAGALYGWGELDGKVKSTSTGDLGTIPTMVLTTSFAVQDLSTSPGQAAHTLVTVVDKAVLGWGANGAGQVTSAVDTTPLIELTDTGISLQ